MDGSIWSPYPRGHYIRWIVVSWSNHKSLAVWYMTHTCPLHKVHTGTLLCACWSLCVWCVIHVTRPSLLDMPWWYGQSTKSWHDVMSGLDHHITGCRVVGLCITMTIMCALYAVVWYVPMVLPLSPLNEHNCSHVTTHYHICQLRVSTPTDHVSRHVQDHDLRSRWWWVRWVH